MNALAYALLEARSLDQDRPSETRAERYADAWRGFLKNLRNWLRRAK